MQVKPGQVYAILGKNGSGKSTLLNSITQHPATSYTGKVQLETPIFLGFQKPVEVPELLTMNLLIHLENLSSGQHFIAEELIAKYQNLIDKLELTQEMLSRPLNTQVSGGENKRIEVLQMYIIKPKVLLLDEIDTGLDLDAQILIGSIIRDYIKKYKPATIVVTHNMGFLKYFPVTKTMVLSEGKVIAEGTSALIKQIESKGFSSLN